METQQLHRGRLIDHIQLVVRNFSASQAFYTAILDVLHIPMGGTGEGFFWADELVISAPDSPAAQGALTGPLPSRIPGAGPGHGGCVLQRGAG